MTIEIADRLIKLRKKHGYSQEELADKLGLSRQAVSKWERAEASPDTDNLICLAKLYGVSLDELLDTDDDVETIVEEQVKKEEPKEGIKIENDKIHLTDDDGSEVVIENNHIVCKDKDGKVVIKDKHIDKTILATNIIEAGLGIAALVVYILLGSLCDMWYNAWVVFFVPEIICSILRAILKKNPGKFSMLFTTLFAYFFINMVYPGMGANLWHPLWVIFLAIPLYHIVVSSIRKALDKKDED